MGASIWNPGSSIPSGGTISRATEAKTVVAGQIVVSFSTFEYVIGTGMLFIFIDGEFFSDYVETNSTSITLNAPFLESVDLVAVAGIPLNDGLAGTAVSYIAPGADSVARSVQSKLNESSFISIVDKGATSSDDALASIQAALDSGNGIEIPSGAWSAIGAPTITGSKVIKARAGSVMSGSAFSNLGLYSGASGIEQSVHLGGGATDAASFYFRRESNYAGGSFGFVNSGLRVDSFVRNAASTAFEWSFTATMNNWANAGENVAAYFLGRKYANGPTWGAVSEAVDHTEVADPTGALIAHEFNITANGTDNAAPYGSRVGLDLAIRKHNPAGADVVASWGYRIQTGSGARVSRGYSFYPGTLVDKAFDASTATISQSAFKMAEGQAFVLSVDDTIKMLYDGFGVKFEDTGVLKLRINDTGVLQLGNLFTVATTPASFTPNRILELQQRDGTSIYVAGMTAPW